MSKIELSNLDKEELFEEYRSIRSRPINTMKNGVVPNIIKFNKELNDFLESIESDSKYAEFKDYTNTVGSDLINVSKTIVNTFEEILTQIRLLDQARIDIGKPQLFNSIEENNESIED